MKTQPSQATDAKQSGVRDKDQAMQRDIKSWVMVGLTAIFVGLYFAALIGWLPPLADEKLVARLEPIIFVIVGYYFGRLPGEQNETVLKQEIDRQATNTDEVHKKYEQAKETASAQRAKTQESEQRLKDVKAVLSSAVPPTDAGDEMPSFSAPGVGGGEDPARHALSAAMNILQG